MKYKHVFWGILLITIGLLFILKNIGLIYFTWGSVFRLWPLFLILWGISILPIKSGIRIVASLVVIAITIALIFNYPQNRGWNFFGFEKGWHQQDSEEWEKEVISEPFSSTIDQAELEIDAAIGEFRVEDTTDQLILFRKNGNMGPYEYAAQLSGSKMKMKLDLKKDFFRGSNFHNEAVISLNAKPVWDIFVDVAAADIKLNLAPFKIKELEIDGGASDIEIKIGNLLKETRLNIDAGAASIVIYVPESSGCKMDASTFLTSRDIRGFEKNKDGVYKTKGFEHKTEKIFIKLDATVTSITLHRY